MAVRQSHGESQPMMKANSRRATKHHTPPPLHQGASKENYNNSAFSFLINEDCYLVGGRASCKGSWMIGKHQTGMCVCERDREKGRESIRLHMRVCVKPEQLVAFSKYAHQESDGLCLLVQVKLLH